MIFCLGPYIRSGFLSGSLGYHTHSLVLSLSLSHTILTLIVLSPSHSHTIPALTFAHPYVRYGLTLSSWLFSVCC